MHEPVSNDFAEEQKIINQKLSNIKNIILVLSGKGGVGKSTVAVNIAAGLAKEGKNVGLLDIDIHGPSIPGMLNLEGNQIFTGSDGIQPIEFTCNFKVISIGFLLKSKKDAVIWRGPMKYSVIKQFLTDVNWGALDYLIVDSPPGTGDEPLSIAQMTADKAKAVIVTTPQKVSVDDVRRSVGFCSSLKIPVLGIIENMSGFICPKCGEEIDIFGSSGGLDLANETKVQFLGKIPVNSAIVNSCDNGNPYILNSMDETSGGHFSRIIEKILSADN